MDPRMIISEGRLHPHQVLILATCVLLFALDGYDVLSISFAAPGISNEWAISMATLGIVLSAELVGMSFGSILLGRMSDAWGRRPLIVVCLAFMAIGMAATATVDSILQLALWRFVTGVGIGGLLAAVSAICLEYTNTPNRALVQTLMAAGYPLGAMIGGAIASYLLRSFDWRAVFLLGAAATSLFIPLVLLAVPESIHYLAAKRKTDALARINRTLARLGHPKADRMPPVDGTSGQAKWGELFAPALRATTPRVLVAFFAHTATFYFFLKWIPKIIADLGYSPAQAGEVLVWANTGGVLGCIFFGLLTKKAPLRPLLLGTLVLSFLSVCLFGLGQRTLGGLSVTAAIGGFFATGSVSGLYALLSQAFPDRLRATGVGFVIGMGRGGAVVGPILAGWLFSSGFGLLPVAVLMGCGSLICAVALRTLPGHVAAAEPLRPEPR
jgi:benzoate transport